MKLAECLVGIFIIVAATSARAQEHLATSPAENSASELAAARPEKLATTFLARHCQRCHGADKAEAELRVDHLSFELADPAVQERWLHLVKRIQVREMPPAEEPQPTPLEIDQFTRTVRGQIQSIQQAMDAKLGRVVLRRLNRVEYENTIRDLLQIEVSLKELLPADTPAEGFDNNAAALHTSSFLMERYLDAAEKALSVAIVNAAQPPLLKKRVSLKDERHVKVTTEKVFRHLDDALVMFSSSAWQGITVGQFYPQHRGTYRIRISARGFQSEGRPVTFRVDAGPMLMGTKNHLVGYFSVPPDKSTVIEFTDHFEARGMIRLLPYGLETAQAVNKVGADNYSGPGLAVEWVEVEGPLHYTWPPPSHRAIFGDLPQQNVPNWQSRSRVEVVSKQPSIDAAKILHRFASNAFRRAVTDDELEPIRALVEEKLAEGRSFEQAVRVGLKAILVSPSFLFLEESPGELNDYQIASRLSYFLWSTMPDPTLRQIAEHGTTSAKDPEKKLRLADQEVLREQVERMLNDPKARAFIENFTGQWLGLRDIDFTEPDRRLYPEFDDMLKASMVDETHAFFDIVLKENMSVLSFVDSDFVMVNERLAKHYEIDGVSGHAIRKVSIPPSHTRGGVLTMGSVLKVTANGTMTSPVIRGAWVLDRILGMPPQPPPPGIAAIEPDIRGAVTIREQLAKHRDAEACAVCHRQMDPLGFALESFDVTGKWRDYYRTIGNGKPVMLDGRRMSYLQGPAVDPSGEYGDGGEFRDITELKGLLLQQKDLVARAMAARLITYATGRGPRAADEPIVDAVVATVREKNYGFRDLVHEIVASTLFLRK